MNISAPWFPVHPGACQWRKGLVWVGSASSQWPKNVRWYLVLHGEGLQLVWQGLLLVCFFLINVLSLISNLQTDAVKSCEPCWYHQSSKAPLVAPWTGSRVFSKNIKYRFCGLFIVLRIILALCPWLVVPQPHHSWCLPVALSLLCLSSQLWRLPLLTTGEQGQLHLKLQNTWVSPRAVSGHVGVPKSGVRARGCPRERRARGCPPERGQGTWVSPRAGSGHVDVTQSGVRARGCLRERGQGTWMSPWVGWCFPA